MSFAAAVADLAVAAQRASSSAGDASGLGDDDLMGMQRQVAASARHVVLVASTLAAEIERRSRPELGHQGLAQKLGLRTPEALVQQLTGGTVQSARRLVRVGAFVSGTSLPDPWLAPIVELVSSGAAAAEIVEMVRGGLGRPSASVSANALLDAAHALALEAATLSLEQLAARARELRNELDIAGVAARENERRDRRYLHLFPQADDMTRVVGLLDPESAAVLVAAIDDATSPRRGGPRFVDPKAAQRADESFGIPARLSNSPQTPSSSSLRSRFAPASPESSAPGGQTCACSSPRRILIGEPESDMSKASRAPCP